MKKRYFIFCLIVVSFSFQISAQDHMQKIDPNKGFNKRLMESASKTLSISSDFTQIKNLDVFAKKIISKGKFYYKRDNKICLDYTTPILYKLVINGEKLKIKSDGKISVVNLGTNAMMQQMKGMLSACMVGDLSLLSGSYQTGYFEDARQYLVKIKPNDKNVLRYMKEMLIYLDKTDMSVVRLRLVEANADYTEYEFTNKLNNTLTTDEVFSVH